MGMPERQSSRLVASPLVEVYDVVCRAPRSGSGALELTTVPQIALPRRGVFIVQTRGESVVVDTNTALVFGLDEEYRATHPADGGDECTVLVLPPDVLEEALGSIAGRRVGVRPLDHLAVCLVTRALREPSADRLDAEDAALLLLSSLSRAFAERTTDDRSRSDMPNACGSSGLACSWPAHPVHDGISAPSAGRCAARRSTSPASSGRRPVRRSPATSCVSAWAQPSSGLPRASGTSQRRRPTWASPITATSALASAGPSGSRQRKHATC